MRQAIETKYLGPTNFRGSRIKASCDAASIIVGYDHALDIGENHKAAASKLMKKLGWDKHCKIIGGSTKNGFAFVQVVKE